MAKTVTIPSNVSWLDVEINGDHYQYKGGETVSVPDEVAELLENNQAEAPHGTRPASDNNNFGLIQNEKDENVYKVQTDKNGNMMVKGAPITVSTVVFTESGDDITADTDFNKVITRTLQKKALLGVLSNAVLPLKSASTKKIVFQGEEADLTEDTLTVTTLTWTSSGIEKTTKVYDLTEHTEDAAEE